MDSRSLIKDSLLAIAVAGLFCCLVLVAQAYHLAIELESEIVSQTAAVIESQPEPRERFRDRHRSTEAIEILKTTPEVKENSEETEADLVVEENKPAKKETPAVVEPEPEPETEVLPVAVKTPAKVTDKPVDTSNYAEQVIKLIEQETNNFRKSKNLSPLSHEPVLEQNAQQYSQTMLRGDFLSHTNQDGCDLTCRFKAAGYNARSWGENLAMIKFDNQQSAEKVANHFMDEWKKSSGHRENLLSSDFTHQGIGVARSNNAVYVTVQFAKL